MLADAYEMATQIQTQFFDLPSTEYDLHKTESEDRPTIFTVIDGNNIHGAKVLLFEDPGQAHTRLPGDSGGWHPLHLACCLGRIDFIKLLLREPYNVDPNICSKASQFTPLHQAVASKHSKGFRTLIASRSPH